MSGIQIVVVALSAVISSKTGHSGRVSSESVDNEWVGKSAPDLSPGVWINSGPLNLSALRGRVVLLEFWTYGCFNCRNTIPQMNKWFQAFRNDSLTMIGIHTPEFESERSLKRVREQIDKMGIEYPVVTDNEYRTWRAYRQRYWPVVYLIDKDGVIRYVRIGEGEYETTERMIKQLLRE